MYESSRRDRMADRGRLSENLREVGCPARTATFTREAWEANWGPWADSPDLKKLSTWPKASPLTCDDMDDWLVVLSGDFGRRKTGLATAILGEALIKGFRCRWAEMNMWLRAMSAANFENHDLVFSRAARSDVLLMDDLGTVKGNAKRGGDWWKGEVADLLRHRYDEALPTIVTLNGCVEDLASIHDSLPSRMDVRLSLEMTGKNYRSHS